MSQPFDFDVSGYPQLPPACGLFVTGTDTEVGKTLIAGAIALTFRRQGRRVEVLKPVATGCRRSRGELVSEDAEFLAACADSRMTLAQIAPVRYATPAAPNVAAQREGRPVDLQEIFAAYGRAAEAEVVVVEGIGGLLCPITDEFWVVHLAKLMALPVVIVADAGLGTINHTLLTLQAARAAGLDVAGVVVNRYHVEPDRAETAMITNPTQIAALGQVPVLAVVPWEQANSVAEATIGPDTQFAIRQVQWEALLRR